MNKKQRLAKAKADNEAFYRSLGYTGKYRGKSPNNIPSYKVERSGPPTSDRVAAHGSRKSSNRYTGTEIMGIATMHKSNMVPVRKDSGENAKDLARMRRN